MYQTSYPKIHLVRVDSHKYKGLVFHATKDKNILTAFLVAAAREALFATWRQCLCLWLRDPAMYTLRRYTYRQCKLFDTLVPPISHYAYELWGFSSNVGEAAKAL